MSFTRIVAGIDGAEGGEDALALAQALAQPETPIDLVAAIPSELQTTAAIPRSARDKLLAESYDALAEIAARDERIRPFVEVDRSPARALHERAVDSGADLIVIGESHRRAAGRLLFGDISRATLHGAPCAVAVAPHGYRDRAAPPELVAVACNDSAEARAALAFACDIADAWDAKVHLATVVEPPAAFSASYSMGPTAAYDWAQMDSDFRSMADRLLASLAEQAPPSTTTEILDGPTGSELERLSKRVDLLVAGSRGWGTAKSVILGSTTDGLIHHAACPVIVVPRPQEAAERDESASSTAAGRERV